ncbi:unnamed protein product [Phytophthora fragariaefolia]|uniref:Unnamed protein product n=1 Tax=Phytophthora fragariaefolia TaxID=1490495 RepID=A0A9W7D3S0_9STRA|nr:unnamed protein product [Phytophthora fragariaefolia]
MASNLSPNSDITPSPYFKAAVVKNQNDLPLTTREQQSTEGFAVEPRKPSQALVCMFILQQPFCGRRSSASKCVAAQHDDLQHFALPTSNACERPFSGCKLVLSFLRSSMLLILASVDVAWEST